MIRAAGAAAVAQRLDDIAQAITRNTTAAMAAEATAMEAEAKRRCPVKTGALRESIRADTAQTDAEITAAIRTDLDYAAAVEMGTIARPPRPYLAPAFRARRSALTEHTKQAVRRAIRGETE